jgi:hypothetical protein
MRYAKLLAGSVLITAMASAQALPAERVPPPPPKKAAAPVRAATPSTGRSVKDLKFKPLRELKLPDIANFTLANGMKVYLLENHELPLVRGSARIRTGSIHIPADKTGMASIFGDVMRTGGT